MEKTEDGIPMDYIGGLLDMSSRISYDLQLPDNKGNSAHISKEISISIGNNKVCAGLLDEYLYSIGIDTQFSRGSSISTTIRKNEDLNRLETSLEGHSVELIRGLKFVNSRDFNNKDLTKNKESVLRFIKTMLKIRPGKRSSDILKYSPRKVAKQLSIQDIDVEPFDISEISSKSSLTVDYIGGVFDACGKHSISIAKDPEVDIEYALRPRLVLNRASLHPVTVSLIQETIAQRNILHNISSQSDIYELSIEMHGPDRIRTFYEEFENGLHLSLPEIQIFRRKILPRLDEGLHTTKQGFYDILYIAEVELDLFKRNRKYDLSYFSEKWDGDIDTYDYNAKNNKLV